MMLDIVRYYADEARMYKRKNAQLLWDMGVKKTLAQHLEEAMERVKQWMWERRYAKWR